MKKVFVLTAMFVSVLMLSCKKKTGSTEETITVGGLFSLTGNWSTLGITSQEAMRLAVVDINDYMEQSHSRYRFSYSVHDTKLETDLALSGMQDFSGKNIRYVIGPQSSAEVEAIMGYANSHNMLVVSQSSTAGSLAADDAVFRFCPGDAAEGKAMAQTIFASGRRHLVTLARNDAGNKGLQDVVGTTFTELGGTVDAVPPYATGTTNFSTLLANLKVQIQQHAAAVGADKTGVYLAAFDDAKDLFGQASSDPVFASVHWYGGDGMTLSNAVVSDPASATFGAASQLFAPSFGLPQEAHPNLSEISEVIKNKTGLEPDAYALAVYDAMWVIARTAASFTTTNTEFSVIKQEFQSRANQYDGITGPINLNAAGDRTTGSFDYWGITNEGGNYKWVRVGKSQ